MAQLNGHQVRHKAKATDRKPKKHGLAGRKAPVKFRDKKGNTWAGRGLKPLWLAEALKRGKKLEHFAVKR